MERLRNLFGAPKKPVEPRLLPGNPGQAVFLTSTSPDETTPTERLDVVAIAERTLRDLGHEVVNKGQWLWHRSTGFALLPRAAGISAAPNNRVRTTTTMQVNHDGLVPTGVFEYQHATGESVAEAIASGYKQWASVDLVPLLDALEPSPKQCTMMEYDKARSGKSRGYKRRIVLGPVARLQTSPPSQPAEDCESHSFCPCCLLTNSFEAFLPLIENEMFYAVRLFASREEDGTPGADCRVNGEDYEAGARRLREYAATWPDAGFEFRKQYVVIQKRT